LQAALDHLVNGWFGPGDGDLAATPVAAGDLPDVCKTLLVHKDHMTTILESHYGGPVSLEVLDRRQDDVHYARLIRLAAGPQQHIVETGIARLNLERIPEEARREIQAARTPLGEILISHDVLRSIEPKWYLRFEPSSPMAVRFGRPVSDIYGRVGVIHCDGHPAIDLLEVVAGA
jgi:chorismate-pyruvate lyase